MEFSNAAREAQTRSRAAAATQDVDETIDHYLIEGSDCAALSFIDELEKAYGHIAQHPASGSLRYAHELDIPDLRS